MIKAWGEQGKSVSAFIKRDGDRYHGLNMIDRKDSVFTGVAVRFYKYGLNFSHDISGRSKGSIAQLSYGEFYILSQSLLLRAGATLEWMDDRYAEYYYGVRKTEATTSRNEYHLNNYFQPGLNILPIYKFSAKSSLMGGLNLKLVPKYIRNSPTMNGNTFDYGGLIGYTYEL
jgi:outer membrane protein